MSDQELNAGTAGKWQTTAPPSHRRLGQLSIAAMFGAEVLKALGIDPDTTLVTAFELKVSVGQVPVIRLDCYIDTLQGDTLVKVLEAVQWKEVQP